MGATLCLECILKSDWDAFWGVSKDVAIFLFLTVIIKSSQVRSLTLSSEEICYSSTEELPVSKLNYHPQSNLILCTKKRMFDDILCNLQGSHGGFWSINITNYICRSSPRPFFPKALSFSYTHKRLRFLNAMAQVVTLSSSIKPVLDMKFIALMVSLY